MGPLPVSAQPLEHPHQGPLAEFARALWCHLQPSLTPRDQAGLFQGPLDLLEPPEIARSSLPQGATEGLLVDVLQRCPRVFPAHRPIQILEIVQPLHGVDRRRQGHGLVPGRQRRIPPRHVGEHRCEVRPQPIDLESEIHVRHHLLGEGLELGPLLGRERGEQPGQRCHPPGHVLEELVQRPRVVGEHVPVLLHEPVEAIVLAPVPPFDHLVQLGEHVLEPLDLLRGEVAHPLGHVAEIRAEHLVPQVLHQLVELPLGLLIDEPVVRQLADLARDVRRKRIEDRLAHPGVLLGLERERRALAFNDLPQPLPDLVQGALEVQPGLLASPSLAQPRPQCVEAAEPPAHPPP